MPPPPPAKRRSKAPLFIGLAVFAGLVVVVLAGAVKVGDAVQGDSKTFEEAAEDSGGPVDTPSESSNETASEALGEDWNLESATAEPITAPECAPDGWMEGAIDQHRTEYEKRGFTHTTATVVVTTFETSAQREAAVELAHTPEYHECVRLDALPFSTGEVVVEELPPDPKTPGVAFETTDEEGNHIWRFVIGVGVQRSVITFCGCDTGFDIRRDVAIDVAAAMAAAQGLPSPG